MNPVNWSELSLAKQVFTVIVSLVTIGGVEYVFFKNWMESHWVNKVASVFFNLVILGVIVSIIS